jgi:hypothetical protein
VLGVILFKISVIYRVRDTAGRRGVKIKTMRIHSL